MFGSGMNLITTVIGFGMSVTFILFVLTRLICGRIRASEAREAFELDSTTDIEQSEHRMNGLEPAVVASLPKKKFSGDDFKSKEDAQCSICLGDYQEKEMLRVIPKCGHVFHVSCIDEWLDKQSSCPVCRLPLQETYEKTQMRSPVVGRVQQRLGSPDVVSDYSQQWLLPGPNGSAWAFSGGNSVELAPVPRRREPEMGV